MVMHSLIYKVYKVPGAASIMVTSIHTDSGTAEGSLWVMTSEVTGYNPIRGITKLSHMGIL